MKMSKKIFMTIIFIISILVVINLWWVYDNTLFFKGKNYDRSVYTVVIHNNTNEVIEDITVSYGRDYAESSSIYEFSQINDLKPKEFRKINIPTVSPNESASVPYNVWITVPKGNDFITRCVGYFGIKTGGFEVIMIKNENNELLLEYIPKKERIYKQLYRRDIKNQQELSWY